MELVVVLFMVVLIGLILHSPFLALPVLYFLTFGCLMYIVYLIATDISGGDK